MLVDLNIRQYLQGIRSSQPKKVLFYKVMHVVKSLVLLQVMHVVKSLVRQSLRSGKDAEQEGQQSAQQWLGGSQQPDPMALLAGGMAQLQGRYAETDEE